VSAGYLLLTTLYGVIYIGALVTAAIAVFARRDFK
jgi:hypothetical protein